MSKVPSAKFLLFLFLFTTIIILSYSSKSSAYFWEQAKEYRFKADKLQSEGKLDQAIVYYQKTVGLDKYDISAYNGLAICYEKKRQLTRAEEWYLKALAVNPQYAPVHYNLGLFYEKYGDIKKAVFHWKQRLRLGHPADPASIKAQAKLKKYAPDQLQAEQAQQLTQRIVEQKEKSALDKILGRNRYRTHEEEMQDYYLKGMQSYQSGDYEAAKEFFHKMIEALPISN